MQWLTLEAVSGAMLDAVAPTTWEVTQWVTTRLRDDPGDEVLGNPSGPQVQAPTHHGFRGPMSVDNHPLPTVTQVLFAFHL